MSGGRFEILGEIGRGGGGTVQRVLDRRLGRELALKRPRVPTQAHETALRREHRLLYGLRHPCVVVPVEFGRDEAGLYLLSPLVDGQDFVTYCRQSWVRLATALPQLLSALRYLHERGIVHGDLSPANVRMQPDGTLSLIDFGLGGHVAQYGSSGRGGTEGFAAPERLAGGPPTEAADLFALGALLDATMPRERPRAMDAIVRELQAAPRSRPNAATLEKRLLPMLGTLPFRSGPPVLRPTAPVEPLVEGRALGELLAGRSIVLEGPSAVGKSVLLGRLAAKLEGRGHTVLWARPRPGSRAAFEVLDQLLESAKSLPPCAALERLGRHSVAAARALGTTTHALRTRHEVHVRLFGEREELTVAASLVEALARLDAPLLVVDDLQWADPDSLECLRQVVNEGAALVLGASRPGASRLGALRMPVPRWTTEALEALLRQEGVAAPAAARVARAADGLPGLALLAARFAPTNPSLDAGVQAIVATLSPAERRELARLWAAGEPVRLDGAASERLTACGLAISTEGGLDVAHDILRAPIGRALEPDWRRAAILERATEPAVPAVDRVEAFLAANEVERAGELAKRAAPIASRAGAHHAAAHLWEVAARVDEKARAVHAEALVRAGRYLDAANCWEVLASERRGLERSRAMLAQAHALFVARRLSEGRDVLRRALGTSAPPWRTWLRFLRGPRDEPPALPPAAAELALRNAALAGYYDLVEGVRLALDARSGLDHDRDLRSWADGLLAFFARFIDARRLAARFERAAGPGGAHPIAGSFPLFLRGYEALRAGRRRDATLCFDRALERIEGRSERHFFEVQLVLSLRTSAVLRGQRVPALEAALARFEAATLGTEGIALEVHQATARALSATWQGRFEEAVERLDRARATWPQSPRTVQRLMLTAYAALPRLLLGDAREAHRDLSAELQGHASTLLSAYGPIVLAIAAATELAAAREGEPTASRPRAVARAMLAMRRPSWARGLALRVLAHHGVMRWERVLRTARRDDQPVDEALATFAQAAADARGDRAAGEARARRRLAEAGASPRLFEEIARLA